jgi:NADH-quinone oxidoreductase subunit E
MSVRRLAPDAVQPPTFAFTAENAAWAKTIISKFPEGRQASAVIPLLWRAQEQHDYWLPKAAIETVGSMLSMPTIRVLEIATFYTMFNLAPVGKHYVQVCGTTPCRLRGAEKIIEICRSEIGEEKQVSSDGQLSWLEVECLGACCNAPMVQINNDYYEDLDEANFRALLDDLRAGKPVKTGSQTGRVTSEPAQGQKTLLAAELYDGSTVGAWTHAFEERRQRAEEAKKAAADAAAKAASAGAPAGPLADTPQVPKPQNAPQPAAVAKPTRSESTAEQSGASAAATTRRKPQEGDVSRNRNHMGRAAAVGDRAEAPEPTAASPQVPLVRAAVTGKTMARAEPFVDDGGPEVAPATLSAARPGGPDDLKLIWGVGPKMESLLHSMGFFHFDQIAAWTDENLRWVDRRLDGFKGRARRDDWIAQARKLAGGWRPAGKLGDRPDRRD